MDEGYYIGHTQDLTEWLERHNQGRVKYCKRNPPNPPLQKGGFRWDFSQANDYLPPFLKRLDMSSPNVGTEACPPSRA